MYPSFPIAVLLCRLEPERIIKAATFIASKVNSPFFAQGKPQSAVKWVWLSNYVEKLARYDTRWWWKARMLVLVR